MSRRKQQNPQHVNEPLIPNHADQRCTTTLASGGEPVGDLNQSEKADQASGDGLTNVREDRPCLQTDPKNNVNCGESVDPSSMSQIKANNTETNGRPGAFPSSGESHTRSPPCGHNSYEMMISDERQVDDHEKAQASSRQLDKATEKFGDVMSVREAAASTYDQSGTHGKEEISGTYDLSKEMLGDPVSRSEQRSQIAESLPVPAFHKANEQNLINGRTSSESRDRIPSRCEEGMDDLEHRHGDSTAMKTDEVDGRDSPSSFDNSDGNKSEGFFPDDDRSRQLTPEGVVADAEMDMADQCGLSNVGSKDICEIKDQVRKLQQQQMYQIQMLNYLHLQLTMFASSNAPPQRSPGFFPSQSMTQVNGFPVQNMPQLLAAAASMATGAHMPTPSGGESLSNAASALGRHFAAATDEQSFPVGSLNAGPERAVSDARGALSKLERENSENTLGGLYSSSMDEHVRSLTNQRKAEDPGSEFATQGDLKQEATLAKHGCHFCQKVFGSDSALQIHLRSHTGERPFKCNICANRFTTKGNLKVHFVRHKDKYPNIEMNPHPVPEYLDNMSTESGIPVGMSITPDLSDQLGATAKDERSFSPEQISNQPDSMAADSALAKTALHVESKENEIAHNVPSDERGCKNPSQNGPVFKLHSAMFPFYPYPGRKNGAPDETVNFAPSETARVSPSGESEKNEKRGKPSNSVPSSRKPSSGGHAPSSSETSKLQKLVDQIDRGKDLEKNECHICRRVLSCQSALKLHYRTHTGERPHKCDLCDRAFTTRGNLRTHYSSVHRQQLRPALPQGGSAARGNAMQCPLCLSRFMDRQSMQQHMQMHLYMQSQQLQQQQIAQFMNGQAGNNPRTSSSVTPLAQDAVRGDTRSPNDNTSSAEQTDGNLSGNDDVFDATSPNRGASPRAGRSPQAMEDSLRQSRLSDRQSPASSTGANRRTSEEAKVSESLALDLTRPSSRSDGTASPSRAETCDESERVSPSSANHSLSALAHLASSSSLARLGDMASSNFQGLSHDEEARLRKSATSCEICSKPFSCQSALEIHLRSHTKERPYLCRVCERGFTTKGNLKQHLLTHNITEVDEDMLEPVASPTRGNSVSGSPANSPSLSSGSQQSAVKRPATEPTQAPSAAKQTYPRHWCHICQKQFSSASSLQIHNRTHTGEKPFACSVCGRAFTTKGNLKVHMGTHVWGAGGSRRGRRISMDNPLISPWMQNTSGNAANNPSMRTRVPPPLAAVPTPAAAIYQQYAAIASGLIGAKAADPRFHGNGMMNLNSVAAARLLLPPANGHVTGPNSVSSPTHHLSAADALNTEDSKNLSAAEWFWRAYQRTQEQVN